MAALSNLIQRFSKNLLLVSSSRSLSLSATRNLKEISAKKEGNTLTIEGIIYPDKKEHQLIKHAENGACVLCTTGVDVKHTDVLILSQFVRKDGCMLPRRITQLCKIQQKRVSKMVAMAQKAGLMPNLRPEGSKTDPKLRRDWKKFNTYYDEATIKHRYRN